MPSRGRNSHWQGFHPPIAPRRLYVTVTEGLEKMPDSADSLAPDREMSRPVK